LGRWGRRQEAVGQRRGGNSIWGAGAFSGRSGFPWVFNQTQTFQPSSLRHTSRIYLYISTCPLPTILTNHPLPHPHPIDIVREKYTHTFPQMVIGRTPTQETKHTPSLLPIPCAPLLPSCHPQIFSAAAPKRKWGRGVTALSSSGKPCFRKTLSQFKSTRLTPAA